MDFQQAKIEFETVVVSEERAKKRKKKEEKKSKPFPRC
jgi:hypothetical protein